MRRVGRQQQQRPSWVVGLQDRPACCCLVGKAGGGANTTWVQLGGGSFGAIRSPLLGVAEKEMGIAMRCLSKVFLFVILSAAQAAVQFDAALSAG